MAAATLSVHRVEVRLNADQPDAAGREVCHQAAHGLAGGLDQAHAARVYLIEAPLAGDEVRRVADELLADPVTQRAVIGATPVPPKGATVEVHYQTGVMDPVAQSTRDAIAEMMPELDAEAVTVRTGYRYDLEPSGGNQLDADDVRRFAETALANPVIHDIHIGPYHPERFPHGRAYELSITRVPISGLDDAGLEELSREGHLFLSLDEMLAIQAYYRRAEREPTDIELESLAQTWSEHCVHKTLKATVRYTQPDGDSDGVSTPGPKDWANRPGHRLDPDGSLVIDNLLKNTIAAATFKLMEQGPLRDWCVSVFEDNAGIVKFDDDDGVCIKVETHNHPSAIEPYGGAATGIGGCIRDIMGTGQVAKPIANTNVFCVAPPVPDRVLPKGVIEPGRLLGRVVAGVRDYGNRMGIPTVNGAVWFHEDYLANPLVFAGCIGLIPLDKCFGKPQPGDRIVAMGGRTGRDGIHGATFSSAELTDTHADQFAHAVQIGNPITQKQVLDVLLQARDHADGPLFTAITDCGAGGFSSAVGEMGQELGAHVTLDTAPLKYEGLTYTEVWISEAQERMVLAVPPGHLETLTALCRAEGVEVCDLGWFGVSGTDEGGSEPGRDDKKAGDDAGDPLLVLTYGGVEVGRLSMQFLHDGLPRGTREAVWSPQVSGGDASGGTANPADAPIGQTLHALLGHLNIASKHWIIRQYDHEVQGGSVVKPLVGPQQDGPSDAAVIRPKLTSTRGVAIACGLTPGMSEAGSGGDKACGGDSYWMTLAAIDEAVRNCVCVGADPSRIAILDNFCWPGCDDPVQMGRLVRAAQGCYDGAIAYRTPFVSGKDSLNNQFTTEDGRLIAIPPTLLITALGIVGDVTRCVTMDAKSAGNALVVVGATSGALVGSHYLTVAGETSHAAGTGGSHTTPRVDLTIGPRSAAAVASLIAKGYVASSHDCSDGGFLVAAAEMAFAGRVGLDIDLDALPANGPTSPIVACFAETPSRYLLEITPDRVEAVSRVLQAAGIQYAEVGRFADHDRLTATTTTDGTCLDEPLENLRQAWLEPLDW